MRLSKRVKGGIVEKLSPSLSAIEKIASATEYQDYLRQKKYYRNWYIYILILPTIALLILTAVVW